MLIRTYAQIQQPLAVHYNLISFYDSVPCFSVAPNNSVTFYNMIIPCVRTFPCVSIVPGINLVTTQPCALVAPKTNLPSTQPCSAPKPTAPIALITKHAEQKISLFQAALNKVDYDNLSNTHALDSKIIQPISKKAKVIENIKSIPFNNFSFFTWSDVSHFKKILDSKQQKVAENKEAFLTTPT